MPLDDAKQEWVARVLGYVGNTDGAAPDPSASWRAARAAWDEAIDQINGQITALQAALRTRGDPDLAQIAETGLNALTGNYRVQMMAVMADIGNGTPAALKKAGRKGLSVARAFRAHVAKDPRVAAADDNPFDVPVSIRSTLGPALARIEEALQAAS